MKTRTTYASLLKTPSTKSIQTQNAQSVSDHVWHSQSYITSFVFHAEE